MTILQVTLLSDGCFAGSRAALLQDADTCQELDELGLPVIGGRTLRGLLVEEVAIVVEALGMVGAAAKSYEEAALDLLGQPGQSTRGRLSVGDARYPESARQALAAAAADNPTLRTLAARTTTVIRRQTRIDEETATAATGSLRATRLIRTGTALQSVLSFDGKPLSQATDATDKHRAILASAVRLLRRGGIHRSRGWGRLSAQLLEDGKSVESEWSRPLENLLQQGVQK
jgi:CRISPR/Cas system CMR subunit Cmr4 (Cas7 group RAMP superfamily)